jgi:predicted Zn-dependent protease
MRVIFLVILLLIGIVLSFFLYKEKKKTEFSSTLAPFYQILGKPVQIASKSLTKVLPVDSMDEKEYGDAIKLQYSTEENSNNPDVIYLNKLAKVMLTFKKKPFEYQLFLMDTSSPNAFAMPGGVIFVTKGLMDLLTSESELAAIIAHEIGHIEKSHCLDNVRFELAAKKIGADTVGKIADFAMGIVFRSSYNKTQEDEADEYAYRLIMETDYDPKGEGKAFDRLVSLGGSIDKKAHIIQEYFQSHPHAELRREKFLERAQAWRNSNQGIKKYVGTENLKTRKSKEESELDYEWTVE